MWICNIIGIIIDLLKRNFWLLLYQNITFVKNIIYHIRWYISPSGLIFDNNRIQHTYLMREHTLAFSVKFKMMTQIDFIFVTGA
mgnify:CR=1 FL=1